MCGEQRRGQEWIPVGNFAGGIIEANGKKRRLVVDGRVVREYEIDTR